MSVVARRRTLAGRLTALVGVFVAGFGLLAGAFGLWVFRHVLETEADRRLETTLQWLARELHAEGEGWAPRSATTEAAGLSSRRPDVLAGLDRELFGRDDPAVSRDAGAPRLVARLSSGLSGGAETWRVTLRDGGLVRARGTWRGELRVRNRTLSLGRPEWPELTWRELTLWRRPGETEPSGESVYRLPPERRVALVLSAGIPRGEVEEPWRKALGWVALASSLAILAAVWGARRLVGWQLAPLARMAGEAATIGPERPDARLSARGAGSELETLADSVNGMVGRLSEALARERRFAGMAAHELRTPIAQIRLAVEVALRRERAPEAYQATLAAVGRDALRMQSLAETLLTLLRLGERGSMPTDVVTLEELFDRAVAAGCARFRRTASEAGEGMPRVKANDVLFAMAFGNVLDNARRYAPSAPPAVSFRSGGGEAALTVTDDGPGIPATERERIFDPLARLDEARTVGEDDGGFGLGLSVARQAMRAMGGDLRCEENAGGGGAVFVFRFAPGERSFGNRDRCLIIRC